jgi:WD40 repeat protein
LNFFLNCLFSLVLQAKWLPGNDKILASIDYSGVVSFWDIRTTVPLAEMEVHDGKGFALDWGKDEKERTILISGGSDCCLKSLFFDF